MKNKLDNDGLAVILFLVVCVTVIFLERLAWKPTTHESFARMDFQSAFRPVRVHTAHREATTAHTHTWSVDTLARFHRVGDSKNTRKPPNVARVIQRMKNTRTRFTRMFLFIWFGMSWICTVELWKEGCQNETVDWWGALAWWIWLDVISMLSYCFYGNVYEGNV
jgi:hypothetical protein